MIEILNGYSVLGCVNWLISPALTVISVYGAFTWNALN